MLADPFGHQAREYARRRPPYPDSLFSFLISKSLSRDLAWDCGTGNGQAAVPLAAGFRKVVATDVSRRMISEASAHDRIEYREAAAEESGLEYGSVDLVTAAAAMHWFDHDRFHAEVRRVARSGCVVAAFSYFLPELGPELDPLVRELVDEILDGFWDPRMILVKHGYSQLKFPYEVLAHPPFACEVAWTARDMLGYFNSWSAAQSFRMDLGEEPTVSIEARFIRLWNQVGPERRTVSFPIEARFGRVDS